MNIRFASRILQMWLASLVVLSLTGCQTVYYEAMEKMGYHKRDILVSDVEKARDAQADAKEQFKSALERFSSVLNFQGGDLQDKYDKLSAEYEQSEQRAQAVHDRVASVEDVSEALFTEWKAELEEYSNANLRRTSQQKLDHTQKQYAQLIKAMKRAEKKMDPVMAAFKDQVLFLKHNLNAKAIASLKNELVAVESDISSLIKEMEASIQEADSFISTMAKEQ
ncbi:MAG: DNA repair ATPase [Nitrospirales bacterium]|nr:MAG: DNA repair ATPase [Nitrospirales bacterium]